MAITVSKILESLDSDGLLHLTNILDGNTGEPVTYTQTSEISTDAETDGVMYRKYDGKYMKRDFADGVNLKWFGAKGDGVTDDSAAIEKAIAFVSRPVIKLPFAANYFEYIQPKVKAFIFVPDGRYKITRAIGVNPYVRFVGNSTENFITRQGQGSCFLSSGVSTDLFYSKNVRFSDGVVVPDAFVTATDIDLGGYSYCPSITFEGIAFMVDTTKTQIPRSFIKLSGATHSVIRHCTMLGSKLGIIMNTSWNWTIEQNMIIPIIGGIVLTESITTGVLHMNEINGSAMPAGGVHTDNTITYGFAANAGNYYSGKCFGVFMSHAQIEFKMNVIEYGMYYGVISHSSSGVIDNTYIEGIAAGGAAYAQSLSAYMRYNVGETYLGDTVRLFHFTDFARSEVHFYNSVSVYKLFGTVHPSCNITLYQYRNWSLGNELPHGVTAIGNWSSDVNDDLKNVLNIGVSKVFNITGDCPLTADVNLAGDVLVLGNGSYPAVRKVTATARIFSFAKDLTFRDLEINVNIDGFISPIDGDYTIRFKDCVINLTGGSLITNLNAFVNQINKVTLIFEGHCVVKSDTQRDLIGNMNSFWARLDVTIIKSNNTEFINVNIPNDSFALKIVSTTGFVGLPTAAMKTRGHYTGGKVLFKDPYFRAGLNGISVYNQSNNGTVTVTRVASSTFADPSPTDSGYIVKITNAGISSPDNGGFAFANQTRANAVFVVRLIANLPKGAILDINTFQIGLGGLTEENTPRIGTGRWEEYIFTIKCGPTGTFETTALFSTRGVSNASWYLAYATVFDMTAEKEENILWNDYINFTYTGSNNVQNLSFIPAIPASAIMNYTRNLVPGTEYTYSGNKVTINSALLTVGQQYILTLTYYK